MLKLERGRAVLFEKVKGYSMRIVGNLLNSRKRIAWSLGVEEADILKKCAFGINNSIEPVLVKEAPLKEVIVKKDINLLKMFPIPTFNTREEIPTISAGLMIVKDPETGVLKDLIGERWVLLQPIKRLNILRKPKNLERILKWLLQSETIQV
jgi:2,5-furandicarboxylate decarboxylase 1